VRFCFCKKDETLEEVISMKVAAAQMDIAWHDRATNYDKVRRIATQAREAAVDLLVLPEMFATGFSMDTSITPEFLDGSTPDLLRTLARELDMAVIGGFVLARAAAGPQNVALAVDRHGNDLALYAKIHQIALLGEDVSYEPGALPVPFQLGEIGAACFICYDLRFPELFRFVVDRCGLILVIASWPAVRQHHWDLLLRARAVESQCFVIGVNRIGEGGGHTFVGGSAIIDPLGQILAHAGDKETLLSAKIDPAMVTEVRSTMPFLKDRKQHLFNELAEGS
jgi:predicted amidohydrolase